MFIQFIDAATASYVVIHDFFSPFKRCLFIFKLNNKQGGMEERFSGKTVDYYTMKWEFKKNLTSICATEFCPLEILPDLFF